MQKKIKMKHVINVNDYNIKDRYELKKKHKSMSTFVRLSI